jgi:hypothetical protein
MGQPVGRIGKGGEYEERVGVEGEAAPRERVGRLVELP